MSPVSSRPPCSRKRIGRCSPRIRSRAPQHVELGTLDVDLDEPGDVLGREHVVEPGRLDRDLVRRPVVRQRPEMLGDPAVAVDLVVLDDREPDRPGGVGERDLVHLDVRERQAQPGGQVREWLEGVVASARRPRGDRLEHGTPVGADVEAVRVGREPEAEHHPEVIQVEVVALVGVGTARRREHVDV